MQLETRRRVMKRSTALGHCICDVKQPCPCDLFRQKDICHCAGEKVGSDGDEVKLTQHVRSAGCASKIAKNVLQEVLKGLPEIDDRRVLVGSSAGDDAGVMMLSPDTATVLTVDVFCPSVDDPYRFGQIAAANSLSDVYAMGAKPQAALSIIGFPVQVLPASAMHEILRGGLEKMKEANVPVIGGHSINDEEVKCGFAVLGTAPKDGYIRNAGARVGDAIVLTKPLGTGILVFANQLGRADVAALEAAARSMAELNRLGGELMVKYGAHAATDVTGFSLLGHMAEIVLNSDVEAVIDFDRIPVFQNVAELARQDVLPGAVERNRESVGAEMLDLSQLAAAQQAILFSPETSGGLLVFMAAKKAERFVKELREAGVGSACVIGDVAKEHRGGLIRAITRRAEKFKPMKLTPVQSDVAPLPPAEMSCCAEAGPSPQPSPRVPGEGEKMPAPAAADAFKTYMNAVGSAPALGTKYSKLIALALSVMSKCEPCVKINARAARDAGATDPQIAETVSLGIAFGGAAVAMFYNTMRRS